MTKTAKTASQLQLNEQGELTHLLTLEGLSKEHILHILDTAKQFVAVVSNNIPTATIVDTSTGDLAAGQIRQGRERLWGGAHWPRPCRGDDHEVHPRGLDHRRPGPGHGRCRRRRRWWARGPGTFDRMPAGATAVY